MRLIVSLFLMSSFVLHAQLKDPVTQIEFKGEVFQVDAGLTARSFDFLRESSIMDRMDIKCYTSVDSIPYFDEYERTRVSKSTPLIIGIPFLSCGIGYRYYELIESQDNFLLFQEVQMFSQATVGKVIVFNRLQ